MHLPRTVRVLANTAPMVVLSQMKEIGDCSSGIRSEITRSIVCRGALFCWSESSFGAPRTMSSPRMSPPTPLCAPTYPRLLQYGRRCPRTTCWPHHRSTPRTTWATSPRPSGASTPVRRRREYPYARRWDCRTDAHRLWRCSPVARRAAELSLRQSPVRCS